MAHSEVCHYLKHAKKTLHSNHELGFWHIWVPFMHGTYLKRLNHSCKQSAVVAVQTTSKLPCFNFSSLRFRLLTLHSGCKDTRTIELCKIINCINLKFMVYGHKQTDKQTDKQTNKQTDRQTNRNKHAHAQSSLTSVGLAQARPNRNYVTGRL